MATGRLSWWRETLGLCGLYSAVGFSFAAAGLLYALLVSIGIYHWILAPALFVTGLVTSHLAWQRLAPRPELEASLELEVFSIGAGDAFSGTPLPQAWQSYEGFFYLGWSAFRKPTQVFDDLLGSKQRNDTTAGSFFVSAGY